MKCLSVLMCLVAAASAASVHAQDEGNQVEYQPQVEYSKQYSSEQEAKLRMKISAENKDKIEKHNQRYRQGLETYSLAPNKYIDMLHSEFMNTINTCNRTLLLASKGRNMRSATFVSPAHVTLPAQVDWRNQGAVTPVKDQKQCRSCWAFSATGAVEAQHFRKTGRLVPLSEQNLVDCSKRYGNLGCNGGYMDSAFKYIIDNGGIDTAASYPYEGVDGRCRYKAINSGAKVTGFVNIPAGDERKLMAAVATVGPVSVAIDASLESFQFYHSGVYFDQSCSQRNINHAVLVVGYGTDARGGDYWLVKNSYGRTWGDSGYIKMARNKRNSCGIATAASYPLV